MKAKRSQWFFFTIVSLFLAFVCFSQSNYTESLVFTTYYPSPAGVYRELRLKRAAIGDNWYNSTAYCWPGGPCFSPNINATADLVVEGNVFIGTLSTTPGNIPRLTINGTVAIRDIDPDGILEVNPDGCEDNGDEFVISNTGAVGIRTTHPTATLDVNGNFSVQTGGGVFVITNGGRGGINTENPTAPLDINGTIRVRSPGCDNITGQMGDLAEYVYISEKVKVEKGDVVVIDSKNVGRFTLTDTPYDPLVAGVISDEKQAALVIGVKEKDKVPLTLAGQVKCKVTTQNGPIEIGDSLTTSSSPGYAMKATFLDVKKAKNFQELKKILAENAKRKMAIFGKALEPLKEGKGEITVLILPH